jgi:hypothetical protein
MPKNLSLIQEEDETNDKDKTGTFCQDKSLQY